MTGAPVSQAPVRISLIMRQLLDEAVGGQSIKIGHILELFGSRGFAFLILVLSLLNILIFMVPFISILFGFPIILLSLQMIFGLETPLFPRILTQQEIRRDAFALGLEKAIYGVRKIEAYVKPRYLFLSHRYVYRIHGTLALILAVMVTTPIPVFNAVPSAVLALLSIGMLQRDGVFILSAYVLGAGCLSLFKYITAHLAHGLSY